MSSSTRKRVLSYMALFLRFVVCLATWFYCLVQITMLREDRAKFPDEEIWVLPRFGWEGSFHQIMMIHVWVHWFAHVAAFGLFARFVWLAAVDLGWRAERH